MWLDSRGVTHTVAPLDPSQGMSPETVASLDALSEDDRTKVLEAIDDFYWNTYIQKTRADIITANLAPEGAPLPDGFITATISSVQEALAVINATEPAWRIDVLEVIQDYLEQGTARPD